MATQTIQPQLRTRNVFQFRVRGRIWPIRLHIPHRQLNYFNEGSCDRLHEIWDLIHDHQDEIFGPTDATTSNTTPGNRHRTRQSDGCRLRSTSIQIRYQHRETKPLFTVLTFPQPGGDDDSSTSQGGGFKSVPLSLTSLVVWAYKFDPDHPDAPLPDEEAATKGTNPITCFFPRVKDASGQVGLTTTLPASSYSAPQVDRDSLSHRLVVRDGGPQQEERGDSSSSSKPRNSGSGDAHRRTSSSSKGGGSKKRSAEAVVVDLADDDTMDADLQAALALSLQEK